MTDNPPVAAAGPLPPLLLNSSIADVELGYILDAAGKKVEPARFECSQIRGLTMRRLPMLQLRAFCMSMGISLPDDATQASLLEALATKKMDSLAQAPPPRGKRKILPTTKKKKLYLRLPTSRRHQPSPISQAFCRLVN
jgi:hypothetical protein